jgi:hypothetical protein
MDGADLMAFSLVSPFPESDIPLFWKWFQDNQGAMMDDQCPKTIEELVAKNKRDLENGALTFGVMSNGKCAGAVWAENGGDGIYIGHLVFDSTLPPKDKLAAAREGLVSMFAKGARKIVWQLYPDNRAFAIFLLKLGATTEGYLRRSTRKAGNVADLILMASFPEDFA